MAPAGFDVPLTVRAARVAKRFGRTVALDGLDVAIDGPMVFGVVGPDGAGKTTLLRLLVGLLQCDRGSVSVLGFDPGRHATALRRRVGYVPQAFSMYPTLTVAENLRFVGRCHGMSRAELVERRDALLTLAELRLFVDARAETLSGGMKQKLALCAALLARPPLLVLDEPTSGVDLVARADLWATIREEAGAALVIVSTNYLDEAERCDRILYMAGGRAVAAGSPQALRRAAPINVFALTLRERRGEPRERCIELAAALRRRGIERVDPTARGLRLETRREHADVAALLTGLGVPRDGCELAALEVDLETALLALAPAPLAAPSIAPPASGAVDQSARP
jgi:ABC-2 type transport system ATP-binding protein